MEESSRFSSSSNIGLNTESNRSIEAVAPSSDGHNELSSLTFSNNLLLDTIASNSNDVPLLTLYCFIVYVIN